MAPNALRVGVPPEPVAARAAGPVLRGHDLAAGAELLGIVHVLTCGSVDDGKSTLIGRLLWDASELPDDTRAAITKSAGVDGEPDLSLLVDGLAAEREQGITIDIAWRYFDAERRRYVVIDSPGHEQYTRNMATGATHADVAIMLIDARHGVKKQTRRHAAILDLMGVRRVILAVNKMDLVGWSEARFREIDAQFQVLARRFGFEQAVVVPLAAKPGDNVARHSASMPWYRGRTLLGHLRQVPSRGTVATGDFRFPVQSVIRGGADFRGLAGTVASGSIGVGAHVHDISSGRSAKLRRIVTMDGDLDAARAGDAVVLELDADLDIARGALLSTPDARPTLATKLQVRLVWLAETPLDTDHGVLLRTATDLGPISTLSVRSRLDLESLAQSDATICQPNDVLIAEITLARPIALDPFSSGRETGGFVLVDVLSGQTLAGGIVVAAESDAHVDGGGRFRITHELLAQGLCAGLPVCDPEFQRRAREVARLFGAAGVSVAMEDFRPRPHGQQPEMIQDLPVASHS